MTITPGQIADLRPGDVVRVTLDTSTDVVTEGPVAADGGTLRCGPVFLRYSVGREAGGLHSLTVVSRAPRPFYVNHPRTEPVSGDVVRGANDDRPRPMLLAYADDGWISARSGMRRPPGGHMPDRLHLLVDGETGQIVP